MAARAIARSIGGQKMAAGALEESVRVKRWAAEIEADETQADLEARKALGLETGGLRCCATTMRRGFRVGCIRRGEHKLHAGPHGDVWP